jgi:2-methylcitrate dehydratase PrpD
MMAPVDEDAAAAFARLVADTRTDALPKPAVEAARLSLLDTIGCAIAGTRAAGVAPVRELLLAKGGAEQSAVWGTGRRLPATEAAFVNAMSGHALDYDDQHPGVLHTGVCVVPAALAAAQAVGLDDLDEIVAAVVVATEVADRLAVAVLDGPAVTGWLLTPLCGYFGAAAAAARVSGLDAELTRHALGFAYVQASGNGQVTLDGALAKRMQPAFASRGGVFAVELARHGLTGPTDSLEGRRGFFHVYHRDRYSRELLLGALGSKWQIEAATFKPYPCCAWTHAALETALTLRDRGLTAADLESVVIGVNAQAYQSTGTPLPRRYRPQTEVDGQFSIPYIFATAFVTGGIGLADFQPEGLHRAEVLAVADRVKVQVDADLEANNAREISGARAVVHGPDGAVVEALVKEPLGRGERLLSRADIESKFRQCCEYGSRSPDYADALIALVAKGGANGAGELFEMLAQVPDGGLPA